MRLYALAAIAVVNAVAPETSVSRRALGGAAAASFIAEPAAAALRGVGDEELATVCFVDVFNPDLNSIDSELHQISSHQVAVMSLFAGLMSTQPSEGEFASAARFVDAIVTQGADAGSIPDMYTG